MIKSILIYTGDKQLIYEVGKKLRFGDKESDIEVKKIKKCLFSNSYKVYFSNLETIKFDNLPTCITIV